MQKAFCFLALSACFFACQRQQASDEVLAQIQTEVPVPAEGPETIENTPTPKNLPPTPSPVKPLTPQPEAIAPLPASEPPTLSPTDTPTPATPATSSWIRNASAKKRANPFVSPSPSP